VVGAQGALALEVQNGERPPVRVGLAAMPDALAGYAGRDVIAGVRAEAVSLAGNGGATTPTQRAIDARVVVIEPTGADTLAVLDVGGHEFTARLEPDTDLRAAQDAKFLVDVAKLVCFDRDTQCLIA
jgi:multiple sugar transport system ATP-binding protein